MPVGGGTDNKRERKSVYGGECKGVQRNTQGQRGAMGMGKRDTETRRRGQGGPTRGEDRNLVEKGIACNASCPALTK